MCVRAFKEGDPKRLYYGIDSYGNVCGSNNDWNGDGNGPDLRQQKRLYFLNPFELLNPLNYQYAKAICVPKCPSASDVCGVGSSLPCIQPNQYRWVTPTGGVVLTGIPVVAMLFIDGILPLQASHGLCNLDFTFLLTKVGKI